MTDQTKNTFVKRKIIVAFIENQDMWWLSVEYTCWLSVGFIYYKPSKSHENLSGGWGSGYS